MTQKKSRLRIKALYHYQVEKPLVETEQASKHPENVAQIMLTPAATARTSIQQSASEKKIHAQPIPSVPEQKKTYRKLSQQFMLEKSTPVTITPNLPGEQVISKSSLLRFEKPNEVAPSAFKIGKPGKILSDTIYRSFAMAASTGLKTSAKGLHDSQEDRNAATDALRAAEHTAFSLNSRIQAVPGQARSRTIAATRHLQAQSMRQRSEVLIKASPKKNPILRYFQKQRIKRETMHAYRASGGLQTAASQTKQASGIKKVFTKVIRIVKGRTTLYATIALVVLLLAGSIASFAFSATTVMGGSIMGGLAESLRGSEGMVEVARGQLGQVGGEPYWSWYGFPSRVEWCAIFVSWVADQNGFISEGRFPKFAGCSAGESWFRTESAWQNGGYQPSPGEVIFFDWNGDAFPDHVAIVESSDGNTVYTIEGNWADSVHTDSYPINSPYIYGYGTPNYYE